MLLKLLRFIFGYLKVEVRGFAPERFMNLIIQNDVVVWDVTTTENGYLFYTGRKNLLKMKPLLQKTNVKITILKKYGLPYFFKKSKKRVIFLIGALICILFIYTMSLFVWEIKVSGESTLVETTIRKDIEKNYIPLGTKISTIQCNQLEQELRAKYDEISWISCSITGTTLYVSLEEGEGTKAENKDIEKCDIVAAKDAIITKMITREGTPLCKVKQQVKKGDILISGTIYLYDDNYEVLETNYIAADGDIYGETDEDYKDSIELDYYEKQYETKSKKYITFFFMDYFLTPYKPDMDDKNIDISTQIHKLKLFSDLYLPIGYKTTEIKKYTLQKKSHSQEEAKSILKEHLNEKIENFETKGVEIIENNVTIEKQENEMVAKGKIIINEPIGMERELSNVPPRDVNSFYQ